MVYTHRESSDVVNLFELLDKTHQTNVVSLNSSLQVNASSGKFIEQLEGQNSATFNMHRNVGYEDLYVGTKISENLLVIRLVGGQ